MATTTPLVQNTKFEELCRLCGTKTDMLAVHIFEDEGTFSELGKKIYNCLQLQIHQQDELPKLICDNCLVKLEMFWDFKDRSFRTEQLLIELYKQLKNSGAQQQCVVSLDANGMILQVPSHQMLAEDLPSNIDISQLGRRENTDTPDYAVILHNNDLHAPHLENLEFGNHDLTGQDLSNHSLHGGQESVVVVPSSQNNDRFTEDNMNLMQQHLLNNTEFKIHHNLHVSMATDETIFTNSLNPNISLETDPRHEREPLDTVDYSNHKNPLAIDSNLSDNSLGVEVDSHFDRMISYSSDSQMDQIQRQEESDSNPNPVPDQEIGDVSGVICKEGYSLDRDSVEHRKDLINLSSTFENRTALANHFFKYENEELIYKDDSKDRDDGDIRREILNYKEEISLDSIDGFRHDDSNSLDHQPTPTKRLTELHEHSNESTNLLKQPADQDLKGPFSKPGTKIGSKVCSVCNKSYKSNYKLAEHMTKHTGERPYKCNSCDKAFRSKIGLAQHEAKHTGQYELSCPTCGKGFQCRSYLMVHQRVHSDLKPYPCTTCGINFKTKQSLLDHTNRHLGVKPFSCSICNRGFITKSLCAAHERTHAGVDNRKYSCKICQKRFVSKSYLQTHSRIHTGEKSFICEVCGKGFFTRVDLKIHLTMHTGEKSYVCEMCGKAFARRDALKCHRRMHTGERPYRCDVCGRTFTQFSPMANHRRHHTGEKPFSCETCGKTFVSRSTMVSHQKKHKRTEINLNDKKNDKNCEQIVKVEITIDEHPL